MYRRCRNNNCNYMNQNNMIDTTCQNVESVADYNVDECACGFDEEESVFPSNPMFGQSYVPFQRMQKTFTPEIGLKMGTIFPELVSTYVPGQSMAEIEYLRNANEIKEGCNNV